MHASIPYTYIPAQAKRGRFKKIHITCSKSVMEKISWIKSSE
jgi:hypothetical protein